MIYNQLTMVKSRKQKNKDKKLSKKQKHNSDSEVSTGTELAPLTEELVKQGQTGTGASMACPDNTTKEMASLGGPIKFGSNHTLTGGPITGTRPGRFITIGVREVGSCVVTPTLSELELENIEFNKSNSITNRSPPTLRNQNALSSRIDESNRTEIIEQSHNANQNMKRRLPILNDDENSMYHFSPPLRLESRGGLQQPVGFATSATPSHALQNALRNPGQIDANYRQSLECDEGCRN